MGQNLTVVFESEYFSGSKTFAPGEKQDKKVEKFLKTLKDNHDYKNRGKTFNAYKKIKVTIEHQTI